VTDAAMMLDAMAGHDDRDSTCALGEEGRPKQGWAADVATHLTGAAGNGNGKGRGLKGLRVGVPREFRVAEMEQAIVDAWEEGARRLKDAGAEIVEVRST
jgi:aspartyl-tRNA(Asn)/glutamyl-tRNA(Gln) amidotransferase subunit A